MNYAIRLPVAFLLGLAFATCLFWALWIAVSGHGHFGDLKPAVKIDFTPLRHDTETESKREKVVQPKPEKMPEIPQISNQTSGIDSGGVSSVSVSFDTSNLGHGISVGSDRDVIPLVRINPEYPNQARERGIEGLSAVHDHAGRHGGRPEGGGRRPKGLFERAALEAIGLMDTTRRASTDARWNAAASWSS
jgi:protein TonB